MRIGPLVAALSKIGRETSRIVLHSPCVACGEELPWLDRSASCCARCWEALPKLGGTRCRGCGIPWRGESEPSWLCLGCVADPWSLDWADAWGEYRDGLQAVISAFKFSRHDFLGEPLGLLMADRLAERGDLAFDVVTAVPMHPAKLRDRGYNQAEILGRVIARASGIPFDGRLLRCSRSHRTQSTLRRNERASNVRGAYESIGDASGRRVLLVDDICTTGETLRACGGALLRAGASGVSAITLARSL